LKKFLNLKHAKVSLSNSLDFGWIVAGFLTKMSNSVRETLYSNGQQKSSVLELSSENDMNFGAKNYFGFHLW